MGIFLHAEAIYFIQSLHCSKEVQINFLISYIVFVVHISLVYKIDLCVCYSISPRKISSVFHFLKENSDISFLFPTATKLKNTFLHALQCKV